MKLKSFVATLMLAAASMASHAVSVELDPVGTPQVGQSFDLQLRLDSPFDGLAADEELLAFGFHLGFDSSLLKLDSFSPASGWDDDSANLGAGIFSASNFPGVDNAGQGSILLATLHFDVLHAGTTGISLTTDVGDLNQGIVYLFADPVDLNASTTLALSPVPEPSTMVLMAVGLGGLVVRRRRHYAAAASRISAAIS
jgi:hypothetical protein